MRYMTNMLRLQREREKIGEKVHLRVVTLSVASFGLLALALFYALLRIVPMVAVIHEEESQVSRIKAEYSRYKQTQAIVDREDIVQLVGLTSKGVVWTKKLVALASHLPEGYWITGFEYDGEVLSVNGYGTPRENQDQLLSLNVYLSELKADPLFGNVFKSVYLKSTRAAQGDANKQVSFEFAAEPLGKDGANEIR